MLTFTSGLGFYNHSVMLESLISERNFPPTVASTAISVFFLASGFSGLWVASLLEKYDIRITITAGGLFAGIALLLIGMVTRVWELYTVYALFGVGFCASSMLPATTLVARWFRKKRAFALSIASTGLSIGGVVITPVSAVLIKDLGIEAAAFWFALIYLVGVIPVSIIALRSDPKDLGLEIDGLEIDELAVDRPEADGSVSGSRAATTRSSMIDGVSFKVAMNDPFFWGLSVSYLFVMMAQVGAITHQYGLISERLSHQEAALALSILPAFSIAGRLLGGYFLDRLSIRIFTLVMMLVQCASLASLALFDHQLLFMLGLAVFGLSVGNLLMLQPLILTNTYGLLHYSRIFSISNLMTTFGVAIGPGMMGYIYSISGHYDFPFAIAAVSGLVAVILYFLVSGANFRPDSRLKSS